MNPLEKKHLISVCITTYEMRGLGAGFLKENFDRLARQTFKDFDVVVSDDATTDVIKNVCDEYAERLDIRYFKHDEPYVEGISKMALNINNAIKHATGDIIKIIFLDDFLFSDTSLQEIADNFDLRKDKWLVTACNHTEDGINFFGEMQPVYHDKIHLGRNTISCPSVLSIRNDHPLPFDNYLTWLLDCDYYKRCFEAFGAPKVVSSINVSNRVGAHQTSNVEATETMREREYRYILEKYHEPKPLILFRKIKKLIRKILP